MARFSFFGENYEYKLSDILILDNKRSLEENKTEKKEEEKKKEGNKERAGYSTENSGNNQPSREF